MLVPVRGLPSGCSHVDGMYFPDFTLDVSSMMIHDAHRIVGVLFPANQAGLIVMLAVCDVSSMNGTS